jgi:hypothetical protein
MIDDARFHRGRYSQGLANSNEVIPERLECEAELAGVADDAPCQLVSTEGPQGLGDVSHSIAPPDPAKEWMGNKRAWRRPPKNLIEGRTERHSAEDCTEALGLKMRS